MPVSLFVSHGAPTLALSDNAATAFLRKLPGVLPEQPRAILVASAHWESGSLAVSAVDRNDTIHDFAGFPRALYQLRYEPPGEPDLAQRIISLLNDAGHVTATTMDRGLDHGAWVPLSLMWPDADIPVLQLSLLRDGGAAAHLAIGTALAPLTDEGVLVIGSGSLTHDLSGYRARRDEDPAEEPVWVSEFAEWIDLTLREGRWNDLLDYRRLAPHAERNHPTEEHFLPLFVAAGAAGASAEATRLHTSTTHGVLRMDAFSFARASS